VYGDGLYVDRVSGELEKVARGPEGVCGAEIHVFGRLANGAEYSRVGVAQCGLNAAYVDFYPRTNFQDGSLLCARGRIGATDWNDPAYITIKA